jgi:hypothetical protein
VCGEGVCQADGECEDQAPNTRKQGWAEGRVRLPTHSRLQRIGKAPAQAGGHAESRRSITVAIDHLQEDGMALARVAYLQGDLVARVGAEHAEEVEQEQKVDAKLMVALALEAREDVLIEVDIGLQAVRLLHREAEAVCVYHAVRLLPPMPRAKRRNTQSDPRIPHSRHGWSRGPRALL